MDYFTKDQVDGFLEVFETFDTSGDGTVSVPVGKTGNAVSQ